LNAVIKTWWLPSHIPAGDRLLAFVERRQPLLIRFPKFFSESWIDDLIAGLKLDIPEHYDVSNAGSDARFHRIMIRQLISEDEVAAVADDLIAAARQFSIDAAGLAHEIARVNGIEPDDLARRASALDAAPTGWMLEPHGRHLRCTHQESGQEIGITLAGGGFGMLDAEFFCRYLETTPGLGLAPEFIEPAADMQRAFDMLERRGMLKGC
jgi:hypothetical protein